MSFLLVDNILPAYIFILMLERSVGNWAFLITQQMKIGSNQINWCNNIVQFSEEASKMSKRTKKVGITGKYGTRYKDKLFCELDWKLTLGISGMVLPWGRPSRRWRSLSTRSTCAPSVARTRWRGRPPASGSATTRTAESRWLEVPTLTPPPPRPPSGSRKKNGKYFSKQQQHSVFPLNCGRIQFFMLQDRLVLYSPYIHRVCSDHYGSYNDFFCLSCTLYFIFGHKPDHLFSFRSAVRRLREMKEA